MPDRSREASPAERRPVSARTLALGGAVVALALVLVAYVAYRQLIFYERHAIEHVPAGAELALRVDLEQVVLFEPVRRHLLPLLDRAALGDAGREPPASRLLRLREQAGVNLALDLREVVFARVQPRAGWLLALGGIFGDEPLLPRIEAVLRAEPDAHLRSRGALLIFEPSGVALGQADDGVLLLASDAALLERALPPGRSYEAIGLERGGAAALAALGSWLATLDASGLGAARAPTPSLRLSVRLELGDPLLLSAHVDHDAPVDAAAVRRELDGWLGTPSHSDHFAPQADWGGERALSARATLSQPTPTRVSLHSSWERAEFDRAMRSLAAWLEPHLHANGPVAR